MRAVLRRLSQDGTAQIFRVVNFPTDGLSDGLKLLHPEVMEPGFWRLSFVTQDYFRACGVALPEAAEQLDIEFEISVGQLDRKKQVCRILHNSEPNFDYLSSA